MKIYCMQGDWKKNCVSGCTVEVKLLCNFSKIAEVCNMFPNKGILLNRLSRTRSYKCDSFTDSHYTPFPLHLSLWGIQNRFEKWPQRIWTRIAFDGEMQRRVTRISERIDFTPNETKEVSFQNFFKGKLRTPKLRTPVGQQSTASCPENQNFSQYSHYFVLFVTYVDNMFS